MLDCITLLRNYSLIFAIQSRLDGAGALILRTFILPFSFAFCAHKTIVSLISGHWSVIAYPLVELVELFVPSWMIVQGIISVFEIADRCTRRANCLRSLVLPIVLHRVNLQVVVISVALRVLFETDLNLFLIAL